MHPFRHISQGRTSLIAFEAAGRNISFIKAAQELNVTQPAISRSIAQLEEQLETRLFVRSARGNVLTADGAALFEAVSTSYRHLEDTLERMSAKDSNQETLTLAVSTAMVNLWFMPRMGCLQKQFPEVNFRFQMISGEPQGPIGDVDLGVRLERFADSRDKLIDLTPEVIVPVSSADYHAIFQLDKFRENIKGLTFLSYDKPRLSWEDFLGQDLYRNIVDVKSMTFSDYAIILQAAIGGKGIALGWMHLIAHQLKSRLLVVCGDSALHTGDKYMLVMGRGPSRKVVGEIAEWILSEMQQDRLDVARLFPSLSDSG